jgi:serine/threonine-protein kinase
MSPEQAQGKKVDTRSDIFSFGVVFYEMLTGARAFSGDSALSTLSAILRDEHRPMVQIAPDVPPQLELLITRCLRKNPDERWQSMKDVLAALGALKHESDSGQLYRSRIQAVEMTPRPPTPVQKKSSAPLFVGIAGFLLLAVGGGSAWWWMKHHNVAPPTVVIEVPAAPPPVVAPVVAPPPEAVMTNDNIIELVAEKVPVNVILSQIRAAAKTDFVLTSAEIIRLTKAHVPGPVIEAMRDPEHIPAQPAEANNTANAKKTQTIAVTKPTVAPPPAPAATPASQPQNTAKATTAPPPPVVVPPKPVAPAAVPVNVSDAVPFGIALAEDVPADAEEGRVLHFTVTQGLKVGDNVVIAKGATVTGSVVEAGKRKTFGGNKMTFRLLQVEAVDGKKLNVRAEPSRGKDGPAKRPIDAGAKGKTKEIAAATGSQYVGYIEGDQTVSVHK